MLGRNKPVRDGGDGLRRARRVVGQHGHLDLIQPSLCQTLDDQRPVEDPDRCRAGWGESSFDELVARMETARTAPIAARDAAAHAMPFTRTERTWQGFPERVIETIRSVT
jgi:hypothetical protein